MENGGEEGRSFWWRESDRNVKMNDEMERK
jgi:hypothetical protein